MRPNWFVALVVDAGAWLAPLLADLPEGIRPFHRLDLHATVAFLGPVTAAQARDGFAALPADCGGPLVATLGGLRGMGSRRRPSAYALTLDAGNAAVADLIGQCRDAVSAAAQARPDTRPPLPHITLARPPRRASDALHAEGLDWMQRHRPTAGIRLERIALYTWSADRSVRQFQIIDERSL
jgi:2'-5' RNA ligase